MILYIYTKVFGLFISIASATALDPKKAVYDNFSLPEPPPFLTADWTDRLIYYLSWFIGLFWVVAVGMVVWSAFLFLTAGGDEEKLKEAKLRLRHALIAGAVALVSTGIDLIAYNLLSGTVS